MIKICYFLSCLFVRMTKINYLCIRDTNNNYPKIMNINITQEKTAQRLKKVPSRIKMRTESEVRAYSYLPDSVKDDFLRNRKVRFARCHVYYPDLLLPDAKIAIEIDGGSHLSAKAQKHDQKKDKEFMENGYVVIRIKNEATECKTTFLYKLYHELIKVSDIKERKGGKRFVESIEDYLYAADEEEYLVDESELQFTDMFHEYTING